MEYTISVLQAIENAHSQNNAPLSIPTTYIHDILHIMLTAGLIQKTCHGDLLN